MANSLSRRRDRAVVSVANFVLRFASKRYRDLLKGSVVYGLNAAARDRHEGRPAPAPWYEPGSHRQAAEWALRADADQRAPQLSTCVRCDGTGINRGRKCGRCGGDGIEMDLSDD